MLASGRPIMDCRTLSKVPGRLRGGLTGIKSIGELSLCHFQLLLNTLAF